MNFVPSIVTLALLAGAVISASAVLVSELSLFAGSYFRQAVRSMTALVSNAKIRFVIMYLFQYLIMPLLLNS